ncbi:GntR family transcriptional regulator [Dethiobacter alkaliphilus]|uniref:Transcriptional regulator, GntR family n=1 Tax=Dethiobacter alkaliphilus AHT 1 TaxID=555088 RepID=C0GJV5_DETAL|nr:GntR family transcriptional regulator [Dethiobacter alkaliphilus]EEG76413.1 transcriptional regulator, GntR family [Dethiobacter alkaliphilus AHT 1]
MWYYVDPHSGVPIYVQLKEQVKKAVAGGVLKPGEQLPSVRELALKLTVNPNTVAKVYQELEREGVIRVARGLGTFVAEREEDFGGVQEAALDKALETLFVEAYQLGASPAVLQEKFAKKMAVWQDRLKGEDE